MTSVLVAPDKFRGSLSAAEVAEHVLTGLRRTRPALVGAALPVADGGEGTVDAAVAAGFRRQERTVSGPDGRPVRAAFAVRADTAIVELAQASGLALLGGNRAPLTACSGGTGELIRAADAFGVRRIVLGLGGSASTDGGAGIARAFGARLLDAHGQDLPVGGGALARLARVDLSGFTRPAAEVVIASDVNNPLLGPAGAAPVFGPQKGASAAQLDTLAAGLTRWAEALAAELGPVPTEQRGAGAAGGAGFAALALFGARFEPGIQVLLDLLGFPELVAGVDLVITGEGSLDEQTLRGKVPAGVAAAAAAYQVPTVAVAGRCTLSATQLRGIGLRAAYALTDLVADERRCLREAAPLLTQLAATIPLPPQDY
ncbi:glycerate kinase [Tamaricihabitans halophyticus]|uniref:Glycerate kinase n=1 Tax=Tamaricihabitans halophyticus TaxID=1262583 RepID=A0A4R2RBZ0_9PSEU|nr:glycerate kinase [Tamaricihabitans halophyticus]TCP56945.1 glycerate kinase [Tamaricihabitans halophyticus]